jgi:hypothetical protein
MSRVNFGAKPFMYPMQCIISAAFILKSRWNTPIGFSAKPCNMRFEWRRAAW